MFITRKINVCMYVHIILNFTNSCGQRIIFYNVDADKSFPCHALAMSFRYKLIASFTMHRAKFDERSLRGVMFDSWVQFASKLP